jgi:hypothetical protein
MNQNDQSNGLYFANKKDHPSHIGHVKINLFKMTRSLFDPCPNSSSVFFLSNGVFLHSKKFKHPYHKMNNGM